ncbi:MAG TPA: response regulator [Rhizomicrobium sp.]|nr:response regulator [Rhizomicrobium sp.]
MVLLVEDEWLVRMEVADALAEAGWQVVEIGSGEAALAYLREGKPIDLLLTDIRLTGPVNGWEVADACRAIAPDLPVVYVSANPREDRRMVSGSEFLSKPSRTEMLIATCRRLLGGETARQ